MKGIIAHFGHPQIGGVCISHIGGFYGNDNVVKIKLFEQTRVFHCAFGKSLGCGAAEFRKQLLFHRAGINPDSYGYACDFAFVGDRLDTVSVADVSGIYADFVGAGVHRRKSETVVKMNVGHNWNLDGLFKRLDKADVFHARERRAYDFASCAFKSLGLCCVSLDIFGGNIEHRLDLYRRISADKGVAHLDFSCLSSFKSHVSLRGTALKCRVP